MDKAHRKAIELKLIEAIQATLKSSGIVSSEKVIKLIKSSAKDIVKKATKDLKDSKKSNAEKSKRSSKKTVAKKVVAKKKSQRVVKAVRVKK
jgi:hypothetical protein